MSLCCPPYGDDELGLSLCFSLFLCLSSTFFSCAISLPSFSTSKSTFLVVFLKCTDYVIKFVCMYTSLSLFLFLRQIIFQSVHLCSVPCTYYTQPLSLSVSLSLSLCLCHQRYEQFIRPPQFTARKHTQVCNIGLWVTPSVRF